MPSGTARGWSDVALRRAVANCRRVFEGDPPRHLVGERIAEMSQEMVNDDDRKMVAEIYRSVVWTPEEQVDMRIRQLMNKVATDLVDQPS